MVAPVIWSRNGVVVSQTTYEAGATFFLGPPGARKITIRPKTATVYMQVSRERLRGQFPDEPLSSEIELEPGFHSKTFTEPVMQLRLRVAGATPAVVSWNADP